MQSYGTLVSNSGGSLSGTITGVNANIPYNINVLMIGNTMQTAYTWTTVTFSNNIERGGLGVGWSALVAILVIIFVSTLVIIGYTIWKRKKTYKPLE